MFVVPESGNTVELSAAGHSETAAAYASTVLLQSSQAEIGEFAARKGTLNPPVRPHLLNQVLLL